MANPPNWPKSGAVDRQAHRLFGVPVRQRVPDGDQGGVGRDLQVVLVPRHRRVPTDRDHERAVRAEFQLLGVEDGHRGSGEPGQHAEARLGIVLGHPAGDHILRGVVDPGEAVDRVRVVVEDA